MNKLLLSLSLSILALAGCSSAPGQPNDSNDIPECSVTVGSACAADAGQCFTLAVTGGEFVECCNGAWTKYDECR
jgi:hypothetical protein